MLQNKIEDALINKFIAKIILIDNKKPVFGIFTGRIKVLNQVTDTGVNSTFRYYFKEVDMDEYAENKDINKAMKSVMTLMHDQIEDIEVSVSMGFSNKRRYI
ncbi:MAG: hypothetical protein ACXWDO_02025 [Bacteroidia bacterium]